MGGPLIRQVRNQVDGPRGTGIVLNFMHLRPDDVAARARAIGAEIIEGPIDRPWNAREVTIADPEGHRLNFTGPIIREGTPPSFEEAMQRAAQGK